MANSLLPSRTITASEQSVADFPDNFDSNLLTGSGKNLHSVPQVCGALGCNVSWSSSRKRRRPLFEEEWACSRRCLQAMVRSAVRRISSDSTGSRGRQPHQHRVPLGLVLLAQRWITHPQLQAALEQQRTGKEGRIGDLLVQHCGLTEDRITRGLAMQWSCPVLSVEGFEPQRMALVMPPRLSAEYGLLPLRIAGNELLYLASANHLDASVALALERMTGLTVEPGLLRESQMEVAQQRLAFAHAVPVEEARVVDADDLVHQIVKKLEQRQPLASRLVRVHGCFWLRLWLEQGALSATGGVPLSAEDVEDHLFTTNFAHEDA